MSLQDRPRLAFCDALEQKAAMAGPGRSTVSTRLGNEFGGRRFRAMENFAALRRMMVDCQLRTFDVTDRRVLAAADIVPREMFLPSSLSHLAYLDQSVALPGSNRALMTPMVLARMIQFLDVQGGETVLEYAGGSGYGTALMAEMGARATLWEPDAGALEQARSAFSAAGTAATSIAERPSESEFDAILVSGACETSPEDLFPLLREGGRLIAVEGLGRAARVRLYTKSGNAATARSVFDAAAPALPEFRKKPAFVF